MPAPAPVYCDSERRHCCRVRVVVAWSLWPKTREHQCRGKRSRQTHAWHHHPFTPCCKSSPWRWAPLGREVAPREVGSLFAGGVHVICVLPHRYSTDDSPAVPEPGLQRCIMSAGGCYLPLKSCWSALAGTPRLRRWSHQPGGLDCHPWAWR
jgi:hypothetical protein